MAITQKIRWQRFLNELRYLHEENELIQSIVKDGATDFNVYYNEFCEKLNVDIDELNEKNADRIRRMYGLDTGAQNLEQTAKALEDMRHQIAKYSAPPVYSVHPEQEEEQKTSDYEMTQDEKEMHESFNKLFRKIAMELHPDKIHVNASNEERKEKTDKFNLARSALDKKQYFILLDLADEFKIRTPKNYRQQIRWMKREINELAKSVHQGKNTYNYLFSECETDDERDTVVMRFMRHLFGINFTKTT